MLFYLILSYYPTVFPDGSGEVRRRLLEQRNDILVERIHVLQQPLVAYVVDAPGVVLNAEVGLLAEVRLLELGMPGVLRQQFLHQRFVGCLRKPALFVHDRQQTNRLHMSTTSTVMDRVGHGLDPSMEWTGLDWVRNVRELCELDWIGWDDCGIIFNE